MARPFPFSNARAEASRKNGAKSRGPKTAEGKARSAQNALKHGMRALKYVVLPDEDAVEFQALEAALLEELAPEGALQVVLARRVAIAAWRLARADRMEVELFEERRWEDAGVGMALIRDGNGTRSFETLLRYRSAAMAEFWRALKTLKALQAEQAADTGLILAHPIPQGRRGHLPRPNEPERPAAPDLDYLPGAPPEFAARPPLAQRPQPNEPETSRAQHAAAPASGTSPKPYRTRPNPVKATRLPAYRKAERTRAGRNPGRAMRGTASDIDGKLDPSMVVNREVL